MSERYTRRDAYMAFTRLASALGKTWSDDHGNLYNGDYYEPHLLQTKLWMRIESSGGAQNIASVGAWTLDYNPVYDGFVIEEILNVGGGVSHPMGDLRRNARDFCNAVRFAMDAIAIRLAMVSV